MALFRKRRQRSPWNWDPVAANVDGPQAWALLTNAVYFQAAASRLDTLGGGVDAESWKGGLVAWWDVRDEREFNELVDWMTAGGGYREQWAERQVDGGQMMFAWDYCRLITVSGGAALADVISADRAWELVLLAGDELAERFESWQGVAENYLAGRLLWLEDHGQADDPSQVQFRQTADLLLHEADSPWNRVTWDRSAGVVVDGEPLS